MPRELILPAMLMTLAFLFYTTGVFAERAVRDLRGWHVIVFWLGLACDSLGTEMMTQLIAGVAGTVMTTAVSVGRALVHTGRHHL